MSAHTETLAEARFAPAAARLPWTTAPLDGQAFTSVDLKPAVGGLAPLLITSAWALASFLDRHKLWM